jgi:hypothetical protein
MRLLSEYVAEVNKRVEREKDSLARGSAKSFEEYARTCGTIAGLNAAVQILYDLVQSTPSEERN